MKHLISLILFAFILTDLFSQDCVIKLSYKKSEDNSFWTHGIDALTIKVKQKVVQIVTTDTNGIVKIPRSLISSGNNYDIYLTTIGVLENYLIKINKNVIDTVFINLPKTYNIRNGYAVCPKCHKSNNVCKISMDPIVIIKTVNGDTIRSQIYKRTYYYGSDVWNEFNPLWYCKRDSIKF